MDRIQNVSRIGSWAATIVLCTGVPSCVSPRSASSSGNAVEPSQADKFVSVHVAGWLSNRDHSWMLDSWGLVRDQGIKTSIGPRAEGGSLITIRAPHMFDGTNVTIALYSDSQGGMKAEAHVEEWTDCGPPVVWKNPWGNVLVSSGDWEHLNAEGSQALLVEFHLQDDPMRENSYVHGLVSVPIEKAGRR